MVAIRTRTSAAWKKSTAVAAGKPAATAREKTVAQQKHEKERSPHRLHVRDDYIARNPQCACCGKTSAQVGLQAHRVFPFHYCIAPGRPDLEPDERNLVTLCETEAREPSDNHHLLVGHLDDFESSNLDVRADAVTNKNKRADEIKGDAAWQQKKRNRLPHLEKMTATDKAAFQWALQEIYPLRGAAVPKPDRKLPWLPRALLEILP